jgi:chemotaxis protein MotA
MDMSTIAGVGGALALIVVGIATGEVSAVFFNAHGIVIVFGGTFVAMLINTPLQYVRASVRATFSLFRPDPYGSPEKIIPDIVRLAEQVQGQGLSALRAVDGKAAGGFLQEAATTALEYNNPEFVKKVLENQVNNSVDRTNEVINVVRTAGVLSPMFGLLGTLIGIVQVLKVISDPEKVGPSMAVAITTAFYGIAFANIVCIPVAGKMRMRLWEEIKVKAMVVEGIHGMMTGMVPLVLERRLQSFR